MRSPCEERGQMNISPGSDTFNLSFNYYPKIIISDNRIVCFSLWLVLATGFPLPTSSAGLTRISIAVISYEKESLSCPCLGLWSRCVLFFFNKMKNVLKKSAFKCTNLSLKIISHNICFPYFFTLISRINPPRDTECFWKLTWWFALKMWLNTGEKTSKGFKKRRHGEAFYNNFIG